MSNKPFNVISVREYTDKNSGEVRKQYTTVGVAFPVKDGGFSLKIHEGLAISGEALILPRKDRAEDDGSSYE